MTDYSNMSDDEINSRVAETLPIRFTYYSDYIWNTEEECRFDPCNNPSDAWPIILSNLIALKPVKLYVGGHRWFASKGDGDFGLKFADDNPLRAAMIVYLMMKESENG